MRYVTAHAQRHPVLPRDRCRDHGRPRARADAAGGGAGIAVRRAQIPRHRARRSWAAACTTSTSIRRIPPILYVAAASGGIWKSTNKGVTWKDDLRRSSPTTRSARSRSSRGDSEHHLGRHAASRTTGRAHRGAAASIAPPTPARRGRTSACTRRASIARVVLDPTDRQHRLRRRRRQPLGRQPRARRVQDHRRRPHLEQDRSTSITFTGATDLVDGSARSEGALRGDLPAAAQGVRLQRRRPGQRDSQDAPTRGATWTKLENGIPAGRQGTHRPRHRAVEAATC